MGQPHSSGFCIFCQICSLIKSHMLVLTSLCLFLFLRIHTLTDKEIRLLRTLCDYRYRARIGTVRQLDSFSLRTKNHIRCQDAASILNHLTLLQTAPVFLRNLLITGAFYIKSALPFDLQRITITKYIMVYPERMDAVSIHLKILFTLRNLMIFD